MNRVLLIACVLLGMCGGGGAAEKQRYLLYAQVMGNVEVQLANGVAWSVKKGDVFPVMMFKEQQTIAVLQLAGTSFRLATDWLKMIEAKDLTAGQVGAYRSTVQSYLDKVAEEAKANLPLPK
jgi:hypothetical protein